MSADRYTHTHQLMSYELVYTSIHSSIITMITSAVLRLECSLDSLSIDSAHVIYVSEGYDVAV